METNKQALQKQNMMNPDKLIHFFTIMTLGNGTKCKGLPQSSVLRVFCFLFLNKSAIQISTTLTTSEQTSSIH